MLESLMKSGMLWRSSMIIKHIGAFKTQGFGTPKVSSSVKISEPANLDDNSVNSTVSLPATSSVTRSMYLY